VASLEAFELKELQQASELIRLEMGAVQESLNLPETSKELY